VIHGGPLTAAADSEVKGFGPSAYVSRTARTKNNRLISRRYVMTKHVLFLLKPGFYDEKGGPFYCPNCAAIEGFLQYAPELVSELDVRRIEFPRPRREIVDLIGASHQGCPVLVLAEVSDLPAEANKSEETGKAYISGATQICEFLGRTFGVVRPHI
jgi:hypothetical protein